MQPKQQTANILILYARFGEGHRQAALALQQGFYARGMTKVKLIDLLAESHPVLNGVTKFVYHKSYSLWPQMYGWVYEATKSMKPYSPFAYWLHSFGAETMRRVVEREKPDAVIHTFPMMALPQLIESLPKRIPMFNVLTDFDLHMRWVHPEVNKYYVATEDLRSKLLKLGVAPDRVSATGIPIRPSFEPWRTDSSTAFRYGLHPDLPIVLIMAGAEGVLPGAKEWVRRLTRDGDVQAAVVCGRNRSLELDLNKQFEGNPLVSIFGFVDSVDELMGISTCIVTKPGGLTLSEAIVAELPVFLYKPVPGQERDNAVYLRDQGAAIICRTGVELVSAVRELLNAPDRLQEMRGRLASLRQDHAAERICLDIIAQLTIMEEASVSLV
jgi:processive 1,2-diacylglycerol beta-glucosyltransferase